nr:hypothetical protein [uncultured Pseudomonas sp.]
MSTDLRQKVEHLIRLSAGTTEFQGRTVGLDNGHVALCTSTYNHSQDDETRHLVAERIALLGNLARSIPTDQLTQLALLPRPRI